MDKTNLNSKKIRPYDLWVGEFRQNPSTLTDIKFIRTLYSSFKANPTFSNFNYDSINSIVNFDIDNAESLGFNVNSTILEFTGFSSTSTLSFALFQLIPKEVNGFYKTIQATSIDAGLIVNAYNPIGGYFTITIKRYIK